MFLVVPRDPDGHDGQFDSADPEVNEPVDLIRKVPHFSVSVKVEREAR